MYTSQPKNLLILHILDILRKHSDSEHPLSQQDIIRILKDEYSMDADRKAIKRNLFSLVEQGYPLECTEISRMNKAGEEETIMSDWYMEHDFSQAELRLLIDSVLFARHIPTSQSRALIGKLEKLSSKHFKGNSQHIMSVWENRPQNHELFLTLEVLDEAITSQRQVAFHYNDYDVDMNLHLRTGVDGRPREYLINPYRMAAANGRDYLICNYDKYDNISMYRLDRVTGIRMLDTPAKPVRELSGMEAGFDLPRHMAEHIYMFGGASTFVSFRAKRHLMNDIIDWFGMDIRLSDITDKEVTVHVKVNAEAMKLWALQYAIHVQILSPQSMRDEVMQSLEESLQNYAE